jgi:hypothetical protein
LEDSRNKQGTATRISVKSENLRAFTGIMRPYLKLWFRI